jgi:hypothetical protein
MRQSWLLLATFVVSICGACEVTDQICTDSWNVNDREDRCPYGPPGGPKKKGQARVCPLIEIDPAGPDCATATFDAVNAILAKDAIGDPTAGSCANLACHGPGTPNKVVIPVDADGMYASLIGYKNANGEPYFEQDNPEAWGHCNLEGVPGGGVTMPQGWSLGADQLTLIRAWIDCGMNPPTGMGVGGGGGAATTGGVGGAGGAGGSGGQ